MNFLNKKISNLSNLSNNTHRRSLFLSAGMSCFLSACTSNSLAPVEHTSILSENAPALSKNELVLSENQISPTSDNNDLNTSKAIFNAFNSTNIDKDSHIKKLKALKNFNGYICEDAPVYIGQSIGDGECVDLIKLCSNAPLTRYWKPGKYVFGSDIPPGTAIATFRRGKYPNREGYHAAIYSHQDKNGIYAWDQWQGQAVHLRYIKAKQSHKNAGNNASKYRIIQK